MEKFVGEHRLITDLQSTLQSTTELLGGVQLDSALQVCVLFD